MITIFGLCVMRNPDPEHRNRLYIERDEPIRICNKWIYIWRSMAVAYLGDNVSFPIIPDFTFSVIYFATNKVVSPFLHIVLFICGFHSALPFILNVTKYVYCYILLWTIHLCFSMCPSVYLSVYLSVCLHHGFIFHTILIRTYSKYLKL